MALRQTTKSFFLAFVVASVLGVALVLLFYGARERQKASWSTPQYHRDPRAPKLCMCLWEGSAFRVPCEDIPPELLKP